MPQPFKWWEIVARSKVLTGDQKVVWDVIRRHDNAKTGEGCWLTTEVIAEEAGVHPRTCESIMQFLTRHRLLAVRRQGNRHHREVRLPEQCYPTDRPTHRELAQYAMLLDASVGTATPERVREGA